MDCNDTSLHTGGIELGEAEEAEGDDHRLRGEPGCAWQLNKMMRSCNFPEVKLGGEQSVMREGVMRYWLRKWTVTTT